MEVHRQKRQRIRKACQPCRQLKRRCNGEKPCFSCTRFRHECRFEHNDSSMPAASPSLAPSKTSNKTATSHALDNAFRRTQRDTEFAGIASALQDPEKARFFDASSSVAFPRLLGMQLGSKAAPRLHSFAWNLGLRAEPSPSALDITRLVSLNIIQRYSDVFFQVLHPHFDLVDQSEFERRVLLMWSSSSGGGGGGGAVEESCDFDAVICGVAALGSFFSQSEDDRLESALVDATKDRLEANGLKPPSLDFISAWILRTLYLRATTRPHASWMASSIVMHLLETSFSFQEALVASDPASASSRLHIREAQRRKVYKVGTSINAILSYEYSRPRTNLKSVSRARLDSTTSYAASEICQLADLIPEATEMCRNDADVVETKKMLESLKNFVTTSAPASFLRADLAFAAYRHIRPFLTSTTSQADPTIAGILEIGSACLVKIREHLANSQASSADPNGASSVHPWWSLAFVPFHFILILLSIDTSDCLARVKDALETLQSVAKVFNTHLTREAVQNAIMLIKLSQSRKEEDMRVLKLALDEASGAQATTSTENVLPNGRMANGITNFYLPAPQQQGSVLDRTDRLVGPDMPSDVSDYVGGDIFGPNPSPWSVNNQILDWDDFFDDLNRI